MSLSKQDRTRRICFCSLTIIKLCFAFKMGAAVLKFLLLWNFLPFQNWSLLYVTQLSWIFFLCKKSTQYIDSGYIFFLTTSNVYLQIPVQIRILHSKRLCPENNSLNSFRYLTIFLTVKKYLYVVNVSGLVWFCFFFYSFLINTWFT